MSRTTETLIPEFTSQESSILTRNNTIGWALVASAAALGCAGLGLIGRDPLIKPLGRIRNNWPVTWSRRICGFPVSEPAVNQDFRRLGLTSAVMVQSNQHPGRQQSTLTEQLVTSVPVPLAELPDSSISLRLHEVAINSRRSAHEANKPQPQPVVLC